MYWSNYFGDTRHLTRGQHGAYLLLIGHYWMTGSLPDDDNQLATITGSTPEEWRVDKPILQAFFFDGWRHKRGQAETAPLRRKTPGSCARPERKAGKSPLLTGKKIAICFNNLLANASPNAIPNGVLIRLSILFYLLLPVMLPRARGALQRQSVEASRCRNRHPDQPPNACDNLAAISKSAAIGGTVTASK